MEVERRPSKGFFSVDSRLWSRVIDCGLNPAVAYLVLACGTGRDNMTTSWSTNAVMRYGGIGWERARTAIHELLQGGFITLTESHSRDHPKYQIANIERLVRRYGKAWLKDEPNLNADDDPRIWLPNSIVTSTSSHEESPIRRIRSIGCSFTLRLFAELYAVHNLRDNGGISPRILCQKFERIRVDEHGAFVIWGFKPTLVHIGNTWPLSRTRNWGTKPCDSNHPAWQCIKSLFSMGLIHIVNHVYENESFESEPILALGHENRGNPEIEEQIGYSADTAARAVVLPSKLCKAEDAGFTLFCPVPASKPNASLMGIARLRYRPHTRRTTAWFQNLHEQGSKWTGVFESLEAADWKAARREMLA